MLEDGKQEAKAFAAVSVGFFTRTVIFFAFSAAVGYKIGIQAVKLHGMIKYQEKAASSKNCAWQWKYKTQETHQEVVH